jgi:hypothetical protein
MNTSRLGWSCAVLGAILLAAGLGPLLEVNAGGGSWSHPRVVELETFDFGRIIGTSQRETTLRVVNPGPDTWRVVSTDQDCGCVEVVGVTEGPIEPNQELSIQVRIDTEGQTAGTLEKAVYVYVQPNNVMIRGRAKADYFAPPRAMPAVIEVSVPASEDIFYGQCELLVPNLGDRIQVEAVDVPQDAHVDVVEVAADSRLRRYLVAVTGNAPRHKEGLVFVCGLRTSGIEGLVNPADSEVRLSCFVRRGQGFVVNPQMLVLDPRGTDPSGSLFVVDESGEPIRELTFTSQPPDALHLQFNASSGRVDVRASRNEIRGATVTVTTPSGHSEVVPVEFATSGI